MHSLSVPDTKSFVHHIAVNMNEAVMLWGPPGVGKSQLIGQLAEEMSAAIVDIRLSQYDSVDLRGIPVPDPNKSLTVWHAPSTLPFKGNKRFDPNRLTYLFLDEINSAMPSVSAVAYQLVNDRRVGEHELMECVRVIAAGNREGDRGVTNRMPTPLANRFTHVEVTTDVDSVCYHFQKLGLPPVGLAFLQFRKPLLMTFDPAKPDKAFATPRTWEKAFRYFMEDMPSNIKMAGMSGAVGEGPAAEFWGFHDVWSKIIPIKDILADPKGCRAPDVKDAAMCYAVAVNCSGHMNLKTLPAISVYLERMAPEFTVLAWQLAVKRDDGILDAKEFTTYAKKFKAIHM